MGKVNPTVWRAIAAISAVVLSATGVAVNIPPAEAASKIYYVNTSAAGYTTGTCTAGNDAYDSNNNTCSLGRALSLANAAASATEPATVTLATDYAASINTGTQDITPSGPMGTAGMNQWVTGGATNSLTYYVITSNVTVDLQNKLGVAAISNTSTATVFYINGTNINLLNASNIGAGATSIVVSAASSYITIRGGSTIQTNVNLAPMKQWLLVGTGAQYITVSDYTIGNGVQGDNDKCASAAICLGSTATKTISNVTIDNIRVCSTRPESTILECQSPSLFNSTTKLSPNGIVLNSNGNYTFSISGLTITNSFFDNLYNTAATAPTVLSLGAALTAHAITDFQFTGNTITNSGTMGTSDCSSTGSSFPAYCSSVFLPYSAAVMAGTNSISGNTFVTDTSHPVAHAIGYYGNVSSTTVSARNTLSNLTITKNSFDGYTAAAIYLERTGIVTMTENYFLSGQSSQSPTAGEPTISGNAKPALVMNDTTQANNKITTWNPLSVAVDNSCAATIQVTAPLTGNIPPTPVRLDVYWTATTKAELFIGSFSGYKDSPASLSVELPSDAIAADGTVSGGLRLQTQTLITDSKNSQLESSQYSDIVTLIGKCNRALSGELTIDKRAWLGAENHDPAYDYDTIVNHTPDGVTEVKEGAILAPGTTVTWTYTVSYTNDDQSLTGKLGQAGVDVYDNKLNKHCAALDVYINVPTGCVLTGTVQPSATETTGG